MVIAAGSVMNEPNKGAIVSIETHHAAGLWPPKPQQDRAAVLQTLQRVLLRQWP